MSGNECSVRCLRTSTVTSENDRTSMWITRILNTAPERDRLGVQKTESGYGERAQRDKNAGMAAGKRSSQRSVSSLRSFYMLLRMKVG